MGLGPSLHLKRIENRAEIASKCPFSACRDAGPSPYTTLPADVGLALTNGVLTVHTAVTSAFGMNQMMQLPPHWLHVAREMMLLVQQQRSAIAVDWAHRIQEDYPEFRCTDVVPGRAFPRYWSCGVLLDNYLSLALGELPPRFHLHMDHLKLQDLREHLTDAVTSKFPELMGKNKRCILKKFLKLANDILNTIAIGEEIAKDDLEIQVTEYDAEFPPPDTNVYWIPTSIKTCGGGVVGKCPHAFCEYRVHSTHHVSHHSF